MHIINIIIKSRKFYFLFLSLIFLSLVFPSGCASKNNLEKAQKYTSQSRLYYQGAVTAYKDLIAQGQDLDRLHFELGKLYYSHGEFLQAIEEFKQTKEIQARKFLGISYYRLGNFTDALEVFGKEENPDDETLYYYGLTCEALNLYDKALDIYHKVQNKDFSILISERLNSIEKRSESSQHIKDLNAEVNQIIENSPSAQDYPQAGVLILLCNEKVTITRENTQVTSVHYVVKILNERGKESFSESHIDYDSTFEKVELEYARTIKPDGKAVEVGSRHIRDVSKYLNFPLYSNVRVFIISFPEITEGAVIEYKAKIYRSQLIDKKNFMLTYPVQADEPIIQADFAIDLPKEKILHIKKLNEKYNNFSANLEPNIKEENGRLIYNWQFKNIPQIIPESGMPPIVEIDPTLMISTFASWQEVYDWWYSLAKDKIKADNIIKDKVAQLIDGLILEEEKIRAIYKFCAQEVRYVAVEYGQAGYEPHSASDIFKNKYGDCKDQAILLVTMLKEAGFSSWPLLIPTKGYYNLNEDFPSVHFNHCIAAVEFNDNIVFLDPTAQTCPFGDLPVDDQSRRVLIFKEDAYKIENTPLYPAEHNLVRQNLNLKINSDETISANKSVFTYGVYDQAQRLWLIYTPPELIQETLKERIQEFSIGAKLESYQIKNLDDLDIPVILSYEFNGPEYLTSAGILRIMPELVGLETSLVAKDKRKYAIDFGVLDTQETIVEIEIPTNFAIKYIPQNVFEDSPWFKFSVEYNYKDNKIYFSQKRELKKNIVSEEEYPDFKVFFEGLAKKVKQKIVLEEKK